MSKIMILMSSIVLFCDLECIGCTLTPSSSPCLLFMDESLFVSPFPLYLLLPHPSRRRNLPPSLRRNSSTDGSVDCFSFLARSVSSVHVSGTATGRAPQTPCRSFRLTSPNRPHYARHLK